MLTWSCASDVDPQYLPPGCVHQDAAVTQVGQADYQKCVAGVIEGLQQKDAFSKTARFECKATGGVKRETLAFRTPAGYEIDSVDVRRSGSPGAHVKWVAKTKTQAVVDVELGCNVGDVMFASVMLHGYTVRAMTDEERGKALRRAQQACSSPTPSFDSQQSQ
jgi:hypothetical protein